jgi:hypothetical protein
VHQRAPGASNPGNTGYTTRVIAAGTPAASEALQVLARVEYMAHHWLLLAVPAFLPAVIVVTVILYVAMRDRRAGRGEAVGQPDSTSQPTDTSEKGD